MKTLVYSSLFLAVGTAVFLTGTQYGRQGAKLSAAGTERKVLYYVDPMNPGHTSPQPGLAPCGMKMEAVYAEGEPGATGSMTTVPVAPGTVRISPEKQQLIGVQVGLVKEAAVTHTVRLFGRVVPDDRRVHRLNAGVEGLVREVSAVTTGSQVKQDQWLASFTAPDVRATIQGFLTTVDVVERQKKAGLDAPAQIHIVNENCRVAADRLQNLGLSKIQIEEIRDTREAPTALRILAPADGFVLALNVTPGLKFEKGSEWYRIADLTRVWILADVLANDAEYVQPGALAQVSLTGQRKLFPARISEVLPQFDPATRTLKVRLEVDNPGFLLRPEMFVDVALPVTLPPTLAVPADAVLDAGLNATVFVARGNGSYEPRLVATGRHWGDQIEILQGLAAGERIVTAGNFLVDSESRMKLAAAGLQGLPAKDLVCHMSVDDSKARAAARFSDYQGMTYYCCNDACKQNFDQAPASFTEQPGQSSSAPAAPLSAAPSSESSTSNPVCGMSVEPPQAQAVKRSTDSTPVLAHASSEPAPH